MHGSDHPKLSTLIVKAQKLLLPCPFCGSPGELQNTHTPSYWVECTSCGAQVSDQLFHENYHSLDAHKASIQNACIAWNTRNGIPHASSREQAPDLSRIGSGRSGILFGLFVTSNSSNAHITINNSTITICGMKMENHPNGEVRFSKLMDDFRTYVENNRHGGGDEGYRFCKHCLKGFARYNK